MIIYWNMIYVMFVRGFNRNLKKLIGKVFGPHGACWTSTIWATSHSLSPRADTEVRAHGIKYLQVWDVLFCGEPPVPVRISAAALPPRARPRALFSPHLAPRLVTSPISLFSLHLVSPACAASKP